MTRTNRTNIGRYIVSLLAIVLVQVVAGVSGLHSNVAYAWFWDEPSTIIALPERSTERGTNTSTEYQSGTRHQAGTRNQAASRFQAGYQQRGSFQIEQKSARPSVLPYNAQR